MRLFSVVLTGLLFIAPGCMTHRFLGRNVIRQTSTVTDLVQQQVLDNVAMFACNRDSLPSIAIIGDGTTQAQDSGFAQPTPMWNSHTFTGLNMPLQAQRQLMENWKLQPVMSSGRLLRLRCAFQLLFDRPAIAISPDGLGVCVPEGCSKCIQELVKVQLLPVPSAVVPEGTSVSDKATEGCWKFNNPASAKLYAEKLEQSLNCNIPTGWFCTGCKAPCDACCTGRYCDTYVWVAPGGWDGFAHFTLTVLALATLDPPPKPQEIVITKKKEELRSAVDQLKGALQQRMGAANTAELQDSLNKLSAEVESPDITAAHRSEMQKHLARLRSAMPSNMTADTNSVEIDRLIEQVNRAIMNIPTSYPVERTDAFDRPGSMPLSRGGGIEFAPAPATP